MVVSIGWSAAISAHKLGRRIYLAFLDTAIQPVVGTALLPVSTILAINAEKPLAGARIQSLVELAAAMEARESRSLELCLIPRRSDWNHSSNNPC
jgi:hypothetical protein